MEIFGLGLLVIILAVGFAIIIYQWITREKETPNNSELESIELYAYQLAYELALETLKTHNTDLIVETVVEAAKKIYEYNDITGYSNVDTVKSWAYQQALETLKTNGRPVKVEDVINNADKILDGIEELYQV